MNRKNSNSESININLRKNDNDTDEKISTSYIISENRRIAHENKLLIIDKTSLEKVNDIKDDELGRTEKSNVHLKSILKNFKEISVVHEKIATFRELIVKDIQNDVFEYLQKIIQIRNLWFITYSIYIPLIFIVVSWSTFILINLSIIPFIVIIYYLSSFKLSSSKKILNEIREKKKEIKEIEDTLDYINEYIDSI